MGGSEDEPKEYSMWDNVYKGLFTLDNSYSAIGWVYMVITLIVLAGFFLEIVEIGYSNHKSFSHISKAVLELCHVIAYFFLAMLYFDYAGDYKVAKSEKKEDESK